MSWGLEVVKPRLSSCSAGDWGQLSKRWARVGKSWISVQDINGDGSQNLATLNRKCTLRPKLRTRWSLIYWSETQSYFWYLYPKDLNCKGQILTSERSYRLSSLRNVPNLGPKLRAHGFRCRSIPQGLPIAQYCFVSWSAKPRRFVLMWYGLLAILNLKHQLRFSPEWGTRTVKLSCPLLPCFHLQGW